MSAAAQIMEQPGDVMSPSSCNQFLSCGCKWYYRKIARLPDPATGSIALGAAVHYALGANFAEKCESMRDLPVEGVVAIYRDAWEKKLAGKLDGRDELPVEFRDDEEPAELKKQGEALVRLYMDKQAHSIQPAAVELHVAGRIGGVMVQGYVDLLDVDGRIVDLKTAARKPSDISSDYRLQVATYVQLTPGATGKARLDTLTKTKTPAIVEQEFQIDDADVAATAKLYPLAQKMIRAGAWMPNRSSFMCSRKYCSFWRACEREWGGHVSE
jgi:CRISPR/Cas system-associated exonuclease Cas4 (RecB family)